MDETYHGLISDKEAHILHVIVKCTRRNCMVVPTGSKLAPHLGLNAGQCNLYVERFRDRGYLSKLDNRKSTVNQDSFAFEQHDGAFLLAIKRLCDQSPDKMTTAESVEREVKKTFQEAQEWGQESFDESVKHLVAIGYIETGPAMPTIRCRTKLLGQEPYLKLLAAG